MPDPSLHLQLAAYSILHLQSLSVTHVDTWNHNEHIHFEVVDTSLKIEELKGGSDTLKL